MSKKFEKLGLVCSAVGWAAVFETINSIEPSLRHESYIMVSIPSLSTFLSSTYFFMSCVQCTQMQFLIASVKCFYKYIYG